MTDGRRARDFIRPEGTGRAANLHITTEQTVVKTVLWKRALKVILKKLKKQYRSTIVGKNTVRGARGSRDNVGGRDVVVGGDLHSAY